MYYLKIINTVVFPAWITLIVPDFCQTSYQTYLWYIHRVKLENPKASRNQKDPGEIFLEVSTLISKMQKSFGAGRWLQPDRTHSAKLRASPLWADQIMECTFCHALIVITFLEIFVFLVFPHMHIYSFYPHPNCGTLEHCSAPHADPNCTLNACLTATPNVPSTLTPHTPINPKSSRW